MPMVTLQILKTVDFTKTQKSRYLEKKNIKFFKKCINYTPSATLWQKKKSFVVEVTFRPILAFKFHFIFYFYVL